MKLKVTVNGIAYDVNVEVEEEPAPTLGAIMIGSTSAYGVTPTAAKATADARNGLTAPLAGTVVKIMVSEGDAVKAGQTLMLLEAMKMETEITAPKSGTVARILVDKGTAVQAGEGLIELD